MSSPHFNRVTALQAVTVLATVLPLASASVYILAEHKRLQTHLAELEPRYARMAGLMERRADLTILEAQTKAQLSRTAYPQSQDITQAGNDAQQRIRGLFADSKLEIISIQVLPTSKNDVKFDRIQISLRTEGDLVGIKNALALLSKQTPTVVVDSLSLQTVGAVKPASTQRLSGQFIFSVLRLRA